MTDSIVEREKLQPKSWYVLRDGELSKPMSEAQVCEFVFEEQLTDEVRIRQGDSEFFPVSEVRVLFAALREQGWYVRSAGEIYGPFVGEKFLTLVATGFFEAETIRVRQGPSGDWMRFDTARRSFKRQSRKLKRKLASQQAGVEGLPETQLSAEDANSSTGFEAVVPHQAGSRWKLDSELVEQSDSGVPANPIVQTETDAVQEQHRIDNPEQDGRRRPVILDRKRQRTTTRVCSSCAQEHHEQTLLCLACAAKKKKQDAELAKHKKRIQGANSNHSENLVAKVIMLVVAFGASGVFLSKWLVTSVVWREFFVRDQQTVGWVHFALGGLLLLVGAVTILLDPYRRADRRLITAAALSMVLVGGSCLAFDYSRLESNRQQIQTQIDAWSEFMVNGGYGEDQP